jgi:hypothetical protein
MSKEEVGESQRDGILEKKGRAKGKAFFNGIMEGYENEWRSRKGIVWEKCPAPLYRKRQILETVETRENGWTIFIYLILLNGMGISICKATETVCGFSIADYFLGNCVMEWEWLVTER